MAQEAPLALPRALDVQRFAGAREQEVRDPSRCSCMTHHMLMALLQLPRGREVRWKGGALLQA